MRIAAWMRAEMRGIPGKHIDISDQIIKGFYAVYNTLGDGFAEKVYHAALFQELRSAGLDVQSECPIPVYYKNMIVSTFAADLVVNDCIILELEAVSALSEVHGAQLLNYLKATRYEVGLLLNFGPEPEIVRKIFDNRMKRSLNWTESVDQEPLQKPNGR